MSTKIESPEVMALRLFPGARGDVMSTVGQCIAVPAIRVRDAQIRSVLGFALAHADPFPLLRALVADLGGESVEAPASPPTQPGPTSGADMLLRFRYHAGCFVIPCEHDAYAAHLPRPEHYAVHGLRVRIVYEHSEADAEAARDCAESWRGRMMGAGAREVVTEGVVVK